MFIVSPRHTHTHSSAITNIDNSIECESQSLHIVCCVYIDRAQLSGMSFIVGHLLPGADTKRGATLCVFECKGRCKGCGCDRQLCQQWTPRRICPCHLCFAIVSSLDAISDIYPSWQSHRYMCLNCRNPCLFMFVLRHTGPNLVRTVAK